MCKNFNEKDSEVINIEDKIMKRGTACGNLFKTSLIKENNIKFEENVIHEDGIFSLEAYIKSNKIIELPNFYGYIYNIDNEESLTHKINEKSLHKYQKGFEKYVDVLKENDLTKYIELQVPVLIPMFYFMFFKFKGDKQTKINILKNFHDFQIKLDCEIKLNSKPLNYLNNLVLNKKYSRAILISNIASKIYNSPTLKNTLFKKYCGIKKIDYDYKNDLEVN